MFFHQLSSFTGDSIANFCFNTNIYTFEKLRYGSWKNGPSFGRDCFCFRKSRWFSGIHSTGFRVFSVVGKTPPPPWSNFPPFLTHILRSTHWTISFFVHWIPGAPTLPLLVFCWVFVTSFFVFWGLGTNIFKNKRWFERRSWTGFFFLFPKKAKSATQSFCLENKQLKVEFGMGELQFHPRIEITPLGSWWQVCGYSLGFQRELCAHLSFLLWLRGRKPSLSKTRMFFQPLEDKRNWWSW